jgi:hypothetical protein
VRALGLGIKPETRTPNPYNQNPYPYSPNPFNPNPTTGWHPRYPKLLWVVRVCTPGTRTTRKTRHARKTHTNTHYTAHQRSSPAHQTPISPHRLSQKNRTLTQSPSAAPHGHTPTAPRDSSLGGGAAHLATRDSPRPPRLHRATADLPVRHPPVLHHAKPPTSGQHHVEQARRRSRSKHASEQAQPQQASSILCSFSNCCMPWLLQLMDGILICCLCLLPCMNGILFSCLCLLPCNVD